MKDAYRQWRDSVESLLITSDEPWIPWELLNPYEDRDDEFFCLQFRLARRLANAAPLACTFGTGRMAVVEAGEIKEFRPLPCAEKELQHLERKEGQSGSYNAKKRWKDISKEIRRLKTRKQ